MSDEPKKKSNAPIIIAVVIGVMAGALLASGDDKAQRALTRRVATLETELAARAAPPAADEAAAEAAAEAPAEPAPVVAALPEEEAARIAALEAKAAELAAADAAAAALGDRVAVMGEQMAQIVAAIQAGAVAAPPAGAAPEEAAAPGAAPEEAAPADDADSAAALAAAVGETGLILSVGQTGPAGDGRIFLSRLDAEGMVARVLLVGTGPLELGKDPVTIGNGCALSLAGIVERRAYIAVACP